MKDEVIKKIGYSALIETHKLNVPIPRHLSVIVKNKKQFQIPPNYTIYNKKYDITNTLYNQLTFALKYEGIDLAICNSLFKKITKQEIEEIVANQPTSIYARRIWFLYEYLTETTLNIPDVKQGNYTDLINESIQYTGPKRPSKRHRVNNNLPGTKYFCPLIRKTDKIQTWIEKEINQKITNETQSIHPDILQRAAAFLVLEDSKASYIIEGEEPTHTRAERWGGIIGQAGKEPITILELERLQKEVITDTRFVKLGIRKEEGFIGKHDRQTGTPIPVHISAKQTDLNKLLNGIIETIDLLKNSNYHPVLTAAAIAFGFVFIHPFEDGNGRIHRYLIHHILSEAQFTPKESYFPYQASS